MEAQPRPTDVQPPPFNSRRQHTGCRKHKPIGPEAVELKSADLVQEFFLNDLVI